EPGALVQSRLYETEHLVELRAADETAHRRRPVGRHAGLGFVVDGFDDTVEHAIVDRLVHEQPARGSARLTGPREVHAANRTRDRLVEIGVWIDDQRILAPQLEQHGFQ